MATVNEYLMEATLNYGYGCQFLRESKSFRGVSFHIAVALCELSSYCLKVARDSAEAIEVGYDVTEIITHLLRLIAEQEVELEKVLGK